MMTPMEYKAFNEGYRAQAQGQRLSANPYRNTLAEHWAWRNGFIQAFKDSN